jgi:beta-mannanase
MTRSNVIAAVFVSALIAALGTEAAEAQQTFLFGAYTGPGLNTEQFEAEIDHTISIVGHTQPFSGLPGKSVIEDIAAGRVPLISWGSNLSHGKSVLASDILAGKYDQQFDQQADVIAALKSPVIIEWQSEMTDNKRNAPFFAGIAQDQWGSTYVAVWQHIHDIFVAEGATNAQWIWSPGDNAYQTEWNGVIPCQAYFPGADYVDWMGLHSFNKSDTPEAYDKNQEFTAFYAQAPEWAPGKPLMHSQTGATRMTNAQNEWISTAESSLQSEFPLVRGFVYFNEDSSHPSKGRSMKYKLGGAGLTAFQAMVADPYFQ